MTVTATAVMTMTTVTVMTVALTDRAVGARRPLLYALSVNSTVCPTAATTTRLASHVQLTTCHGHPCRKVVSMRPLLEPEWTSVTAVTNQGPREWSGSQVTKAGRPPLVSLGPFTWGPATL